MTKPMQPKYPIYIVSKGRYEQRITPRYLDSMSVDYKVVVEPQEFDLYAKNISTDKLLTLDMAFKERYETCDAFGTSRPTGSGPARNFAWEHAKDRGHARYWVMDDNIFGFYRLNRNTKIKIYGSAAFRVMEEFVDRYQNIAMAGPNYESFAPSKEKLPPFHMNTRIYSCNLIDTALSERWRGRFNEDTILSIDLLKKGWCTVLFNAVLQNKAWTKTIKGGNTDELYRDGTEEKSRMLERVHPDVATCTMRYGRHHHHVDYRSFQANKLRRRADVKLTGKPNEFGMKLRKKT